MPILLWPRAFKALSKYSVFNSCSWTRDWTHVPRIGSQRLIHSTPREVPFCLLTGAWAGTAGSPWSQRIHAELGHPGARLWDAQIHKEQRQPRPSSIFFFTVIPVITGGFGSWLVSVLTGAPTTASPILTTEASDSSHPLSHSHLHPWCKLALWQAEPCNGHPQERAHGRASVDLTVLFPTFSRCFFNPRSY